MNYPSENLVSQEFVYSCPQPVIDDLLESFPVGAESVLNYSKPTLAAQANSILESEAAQLIEPPTSPMVMVQTVPYELPPVSSSLKGSRSCKLKSTIDVKTYCNSELNSFFMETPTLNNVTDLSKQMNTTVADTYCDVQSQPMQLTLNTSSRTTECAKVSCKRPSHKAVEPVEKACNYTMLQNWFQPEQIRSIGKQVQEVYEQPQTQPLQLTQVNSNLSVTEKRRPKRNKKKNVTLGEASLKSIKCTYCDKMISSRNLKDHLRIHTGERPYSCGECGFSVLKKSNLRVHKRVHSGEKPFMCGLCYKLFSQSSHLSSHMITHTGKKNYECGECKKLFGTNSILKQHVSKQHTGDLKFSCYICDKKFGCKSWLNVHTKVHFQKRQYQCDICKKRFKDKFYVAKHKKMFCGNEGYVKRWKVPGVQKPPGRRKKCKPSDQAGLTKRPRGRPKFSHKKRKSCSRKHKLIYEDIEEDADDPSDQVVTGMATIIDEDPLALKINNVDLIKRNDESICQKFQYDDDKNNKMEETTFPACSLETFTSTVTATRGLSVDACDESRILELDLSAETILDFTKQDSQTLQQCFAEPQNLSSTSSSLRHSNEVSGVTTPVNNNHFCSALCDINVYTQPQNLSIPQNLSMNQQMSHSIDNLEPQNLSVPQKFMSHPLWQLSDLQPENLSVTIEPQNLSIQHSLTQPQNLSLSQPQNLSHAGNVSHNMHHSHINPHVHVHNLSSGLINTSNSLPDPHVFSHSQDFTQPQNLTIDQRSFNNGNRNYTQNQPQNLVLPQNLSFDHIL